MEDRMVLEQLFEELGDRRREVDEVDAVQPGAEVDFGVYGKSILKALWPVPPELCGQGKWWRSPLGRSLALVGHPDSKHVTIRVATEILEVKPETLQKLASRGKLTKIKLDNGGGVKLLTGEILNRLVVDGRTERSKN